MVLTATGVTKLSEHGCIVAMRALCVGLEQGPTYLWLFATLGSTAYHVNFRELHRALMIMLYACFHCITHAVLSADGSRLGEQCRFSILTDITARFR